MTKVAIAPTATTIMVPKLNHHAVCEVFQVAGKIRTDLFDLDLKLFDLAT